jgi:hypothetical protein
VATLRNLHFKISKYEVHQVGLKDSGSQNFTFLALKGKAVGVTQILCTMARDRRKKFIAQIMNKKFIKIPEK